MRRICAPFVNEAGVALALTLVLLTLVAVLVLELNYLVRVDIHAATNFRDGMRGYYLAKSGVTVAKMLFSRKVQELEELKRGLLAGGTHTLPLGEDLVTLQVTDEGGKINLNALASEADTAQVTPQRGRPPPVNSWIQISQDLFQRLGIDPALVGAIKDWVDQDDLATGAGGAESSYYRGLQKPYTARNGPMETVGELRLIRGFTDEIFLKLGAKRVGGIVDPTTNAYLTVLPTQPGATWRVNLNTAPPLILASLTSEVGQFAELIVQQRSKTWIEKMGDLQQLGITGDAYRDFSRRGTLTSTYYLVNARGIVGETTKQVTALLRAGGEQGGQILYWRVQ